MTAELGHRELTVLAFHRIGHPPPDGWDTWHYLPVDVFLEQLTFLRDRGWNVIDRESFLRGLDDPRALPERAALLTFDDGCRSMRETVLPILRRFDFPAVLFIPTDFIGLTSSFDAGVEPDERICDWDDLRELDRHGVSIQSHGTSHHWLSLLDREQQARELTVSKQVLEDGLGGPVELFAYPYSDAGADPQATGRMLAEAGYGAAFLCGGGPSTNRLPIADPYSISRLAMYRDTDLERELESGK